MNTKKLNNLSLKPIHKPAAHIRESPEGLPSLDKAPLISMCGSRGSGKSMTCTNLLRLYQEHPQKENGIKTFQRCFIISPTYEENIHYWNFLPIDEKNDVYINPTITAVNKVVKSIDDDLEEYKDYLEKKELVISGLKVLADKGVQYLTDPQLLACLDCDFNLSNLKWKYSPLETPPMFALIIDDSSHTKIYSNSSANKFSNLTLRNRHKNCAIFMLVQSYKTGVPKFLRQGNLSIMCVWRCYDTKLIRDMYDEISNDLTFDEWEKLFKYCTGDEDGHSFLTIMFDLPKNNGKYRKNLNYIINPDDLKHIEYNNN